MNGEWEDPINNQISDTQRIRRIVKEEVNTAIVPVTEKLRAEMRKVSQEAVKMEIPALEQRLDENMRKTVADLGRDIRANLTLSFEQFKADMRALFHEFKEEQNKDRQMWQAGWSEVVKANQQRQIETEKQVERLQKDTNDVNVTQARIGETLNQLNKTLVGDPDVTNDHGLRGNVQEMKDAYVLLNGRITDIEVFQNRITSLSERGGKILRSLASESSKVAIIWIARLLAIAVGGGAGAAIADLLNII